MNEDFINEINLFIEKLTNKSHDYEKFISLLVNNLFVETTEQNKQIAFNAFMTADKKLCKICFVR